MLSSHFNNAESINKGNSYLLKIVLIVTTCLLLDCFYTSEHFPGFIDFVIFRFVVVYIKGYSDSQPFSHIDNVGTWNQEQLPNVLFLDQRDQTYAKKESKNGSRCHKKRQLDKRWSLAFVWSGAFVQFPKR